MKNFEVLGEMLNDNQAARILGVKPSTMRSWRCRGIGPSYHKLGEGVRARTRYTRTDLEAFVLQGRRVLSVRAAREN
jgi:Helix-turn-helix domain